MTKLYNSFRRWLRMDAPYLHRDIAIGFRNLIKWFPIIWNDRGWDQYYIYKILEFKLKQQAEYIGQRDIHTMAKHDASRMKLCAKLIKLLNDDFYELEYQNYHKEDFNFERLEEDPGYSKLVTTVLESDLSTYFKKYPLQYKKAIEMDIKDWNYTDKTDISIALFIGRKNHERARRLLFRIMEEEIEGWWD